jgi:hypothetical protein
MTKLKAANVIGLLNYREIVVPEIARLQAAALRSL